MNSPGCRSSADRTVLTETLIPGTTAAAWEFTSWVSRSRSLRRNLRTSMADIGGPRTSWRGYQGTCRLIHFNAGPTIGRSCQPRDMTWPRIDSAVPLSRTRITDAW